MGAIKRFWTGMHRCMFRGCKEDAYESDDYCPKHKRLIKAIK